MNVHRTVRSNAASASQPSSSFIYWLCQARFLFYSPSPLFPVCFSSRLAPIGWHLGDEERGAARWRDRVSIHSSQCLPLTPSFRLSFHISPSPLSRPSLKCHAMLLCPLNANLCAVDKHTKFTRRGNSGDAGGGRQRTKRCTPGLFKIFVGGLAPGVNDQEFADYFEPFGTMTDSCVIIDDNTGQPKGFGFVTFDSAIPVDEIMHRSDHVIKGKEVYLYACERVSTFLYVNMCECF